MQDRDQPPSPARDLEASLGAPDAKSFTDTAQLVERARQASAGSFEQLWHRFVPALEVTLAGKLQTFARSRLSTRLRQEIPDLLQTTMLKASRHLDDFDYRGSGSLLAWLRQIAIHEFKNRMDYWIAERRDVNREGTRLGASDTNPMRPEPTADAPGPRTTAEITEQRMRVGAALESLDPVCRDILFFRYFGGASWAEIAEQLDYSSADAVRMDCTRRALPAFAIALGRPSNETDSLE